MTDQKPVTGAESVRWDLSFLYSGVDDPRLDTDLSEWCRLATSFHAAHKGKLSETLGQAIRDLVVMKQLEDKIGVFLGLRAATDTGDAAVKAKMAEMMQKMAEFSGNKLNFFDHELVALSDENIAAQIAADETVRKHRTLVEQVRVFRKHLLSEEVEAALVKRSPFGAGAWSEFFDEFESDLRFPFDGESASLTELNHRLTDEQDAGKRAEILKAINAGLGGHFAKFSAATLWQTAGKKALEDRERGYAHPMEARNKVSRIPDAVVDALHAAVLGKAAPLARRFYALKAAHLGLTKLKWSDRNAPMPFADTSVVPWDKAVEMVTAAYRSFSPTMADLIASMIADKRTDAPATKTKQGGAFNCSFSMPGGKPISVTFLNYLGSNRDVMTVAHEWGHGVHGLLAGESQGALMQHAPMAYAETASVFGEKTTFNYLKKRVAETGDAKSQLALIMGKLDDIMNTVVRQISFSEFERRLHGWDPLAKTWTQPRKRSADELDMLWLQVTAEFYGAEGDVFTYENVEHLWTYISHFHRPFYVYAYAFGELLTQSLYARQAELGDRFEPLYLDLLRAGDTKDVVELTAPFGLDPTHAEFWSAGIRVGIEALLEEAETLSKELGVTVA